MTPNKQGASEERVSALSHMAINHFGKTIMLTFTGINHLAMVTGDMDATIRFWRDLLGMRLVAGLGKPGFRHYFFEISAQDMIAFFEWPEVEKIPLKDHGVPVKGPFAFDHISFGWNGMKTCGKSRTAGYSGFLGVRNDRPRLHPFHLRPSIPTTFPSSSAAPRARSILTNTPDGRLGPLPHHPRRARTSVRPLACTAGNRSRRARCISRRRA